MEAIDDIIQSDLKPKEKLIRLAEEIGRNKNLIPALIERFNKGKDAEKGLYVEALEAVSQTGPEFIIPHLAFILDQINHKAPRVKWEASRIVANLAKEYPDQAAEAAPMLLKNTNDKGTVVRWSAALALTEIAKHNAEARKELLPRLKEIEEKEENNGVKNIYKKAFKSLVKK